MPLTWTNLLTFLIGFHIFPRKVSDTIKVKIKLLSYLRIFTIICKTAWNKTAQNSLPL